MLRFLGEEFWSRVAAVRGARKELSVMEQIELIYFNAYADLHKERGQLSS